MRAGIIASARVAPSSVDYRTRILSLSPVHYWRLGDASGPVATDETGKTGSAYTGSPTLGAAGLLTGDADTAMVVSGAAGQGVETPAIPANQIASGTVEAWIKTTNAGSGHRGIVVRSNSFGVYAQSNILIGFIPGVGDVSSGVNIADGVRHHVVWVFDNGVAGGSRLYLDGSAVGSPATHGYVTLLGSITVGYSSAAGQDFAGTVDEAAVYDYCLSPSDIAANYLAGTT
jgi:hypothetical protein